MSSVAWQLRAGSFLYCEKAGQPAINPTEPTLPHTVEKLRADGKAFHVGCRSGIAANTLAQEFPEEPALGYDSHPSSIRCERTTPTTPVPLNLFCFPGHSASSVS